MQLVDKKVLEELAKRQAVVEAEEFSYEHFTELWRKTYDEVSKNFKSEDKRLAKSYQEVKQFLKKKSPPIRFVGKGTSRIVFACDGGKCLKIAYKQIGIEQNIAEIKNCIQDKKYSCFAKIYNYDQKKASLLSECCSKITAEQLVDEFGVKDNIMLYKILNVIINACKCDVKKALNILKNDLNKFQPEDSANYKEIKWTYLSAIRFCEAYINPLNPISSIIHDLIQFYIDNGKNDSALAIDDLAFAENWGYAIRNGEVVPVIIDAGYNSKIKKLYHQ